MEFTDDDRKEYELWKASKNSITKIEVQAEKVDPLVKKEKKPRTEKQLEATKRMREALLTRRKDHNEKKTEHSEQYKIKMLEAHEKADQIRELNPNAHVVVKSKVGRPRGVKNPPVDPTPYQSDEEEEAERIAPEPKKITRHQPTAPRSTPTPRNDSRDLVPRMSPLEMYLRKLNGY
jgi:hypothetical protein